EVGVRFGVAHTLDRTLDAHLALHRLPVKAERRPGMREQLASLAALVIGVEHEPACIDVLEQDDARRRMSGVVDGGERHGGGLRQERPIHAACLGEQRGEVRDRIGRRRLIVRRLRSAHGVMPRCFNSFFASLQPAAAALRNQATACESSCATPRPLAYMNPTLYSACGSRGTPFPMPYNHPKRFCAHALPWSAALRYHDRL